jgi:outer membrane biosynthesis protein TonB
MTSNARRNVSAPLLGVVLLALAGCASSFDALPEKMGGLPATAPARSAEALTFPNVYEVRPTREAKPLNDDDQKKLESELVTLREQQKNLANPPPPPPPPPPPAKVAKPASKTPAKTNAAKKEPAKPAKTADKTAKKKDPVVPESGSAPLKPIN